MDGRTERTSRVVVTSQCADGVNRADIEISRYDSNNTVADEECFNPESCCDAREKALIAELRELLRPTCAPQCLISSSKQRSIVAAWRNLAVGKSLPHSLVHKLKSCSHASMRGFFIGVTVDDAEFGHIRFSCISSG
ncbi:hypothetical protein OZX57_05985 [Bifidobacterium sp. ESL0682]|uniref:hypothetical protein n=1 Tax=Bifidobacterium sp. ESL0682 TaxID=2983212 RepID=UPI0023F69987|nr:hypothetical protein [Bifidobacterium sp. ESL0682]WEV41558.1 hypothetical protein OZX57_05985 [Bifidobacterium sp. ESL0682]